MLSEPCEQREDPFLALSQPVCQGRRGCWGQEHPGRPLQLLWESGLVVVKAWEATFAAQHCPLASSAKTAPTPAQPQSLFPAHWVNSVLSSLSRPHLCQLIHFKCLEKVSNSRSELQSFPPQRWLRTWAANSRCPCGPQGYLVVGRSCAAAGRLWPQAWRIKGLLWSRSSFFAYSSMNNSSLAFFIG